MQALSPFLQNPPPPSAASPPATSQLDPIPWDGLTPPLQLTSASGWARTLREPQSVAPTAAWKWMRRRRSGRETEKVTWLMTVNRFHFPWLILIHPRSHVRRLINGLDVTLKFRYCSLISLSFFINLVLRCFDAFVVFCALCLCVLMCFALN